MLAGFVNFATCLILKYAKRYIFRWIPKMKILVEPYAINIYIYIIFSKFYAVY